WTTEGLGFGAPQGARAGQAGVRRTGPAHQSRSAGPCPPGGPSPTVAAAPRPLLRRPLVVDRCVIGVLKAENPDNATVEARRGLSRPARSGGARRDASRPVEIRQGVGTSAVGVLEENWPRWRCSERRGAVPAPCIGACTAPTPDINTKEHDHGLEDLCRQR